MNVKLLEDRVLIKVPEETKTDSGLLVAKDYEASHFKQGTVQETGPGRIREDGITQSLTVQKGDEVLFSYGQEITFGGEKFFLVKESDIAVILEKKTLS